MCPHGRKEGGESVEGGGGSEEGGGETYLIPYGTLHLKVLSSEMDQAESRLIR